MAENGQIGGEVGSVAVQDLPEISELADSQFLVKLPEFVDDIFAREYQGLMQFGEGSPVAYRNSDLKALMVNPEVANMSGAEMTRMMGETAGMEVPGWERFVSGSVFTMLPPLHAPARQMLSRPLARGRMPSYKDLSEEVVREVAQEVSGREVLDYQHEYAGRIAARFWRRVIGLTDEEERSVQRLADRITPAFKVDCSADEAKDVNSAAGEYMDVFAGAIAREIDGGRNELLTGMAIAFDEVDEPGKPANASDYIAANLFDAVHTIKVGLTNVAYSLLSNPDAREQVKRDPELIADAVQEGLRYHSPISFTQRVTVSEVVHEDVVIPPKTPVTMAWSLGNRDPESFSDPNEFRLGRSSRMAMTFGGGFHICPGRNITVLMIEAALRVWIEDGQQIALASPPKWGPASFLGQLDSIPVSISS